MATDLETLTVSLEASVAKFTKEFARAREEATQHLDAIESKAGETSAVLRSLKSGLVGLAAGFSLDQITSAFLDLTKAIAETGRVAKATGLSTDRLQELRYAAAINGAPAGAVDSSVQNLASKANTEMREGEGDLTKLLEANNMKLTERNGQLKDTNTLLNDAATLLQNAATEQDKIDIAKAFGLSEDLIRTLERGPQALQDMANQAQAAGAVLDSETIRKAQEFETAWNTAVTNWAAVFKANAGGIIETLNEIIGLAKQFIDWISRYANMLGIAGALKNNGGDLTKLTEEQLKYLSNKDTRGETQTQAERDALAAKQADRRAAAAAAGDYIGPRPPAAAPTGRRTVIPKAGGGGGGGGGGGSDAESLDAFERAQQSMQRRISLLDADTEAVGKNDAARERLRATAVLEEAAQRANREAGKADIAVTDDQRAAINKLADDAEKAAKRLSDARQEMRQSLELQNFAGSTLIDVLDKASQKGANLADIFEDVARSIAKAALQAAILGQGPLAGLFGTSAESGSGTTGGLIGSIVSAFRGGSGGSADIGGFSAGSGLTDADFGFRAAGGPVEKGRPYVVGEQRPEVFVPSTSGRIIPGVPSGMRGGGGANVIINNYEGAPVSSRTNGNGDTQVDIGKMVDNMLAERMRGGRGAASKAVLARATRADLRG